MRPCAKSKWPGCVTWLTGNSAKAKIFPFFPFFCLILCWTLFIATILWRMAKYILKTTQSFGSKIKHWCLMWWRTSVTGVKFRRKRKSVLHYIVCRCWSWNISTHITDNIRPRDISEPLTPKTKLSDNRFYMHCVKQYLFCANRWLR